MSEENLERLDALSPMYVQLEAENWLKRLLWIISEYLPLRQSYQKWGTHDRFITRALHRSRGRIIPTAWSGPESQIQTWSDWFGSWLPWSRGYTKLATEPLPDEVVKKVLVHRSVQMRMQASGTKLHVDSEMKYMPKAILGVSWDNCDINKYVKWVE